VTCDVCSCPHTLQGINLHLIGAVGSGHDGSECSVTGISFSIFPADPTSKEVSSATPVYSTNIDVTAGANHNAFTWGTAPGNVTTIFYTDIYDSADDAVDARGFNLTAGTYYWLRVKVFSELTAAKRCFVFCKCTLFNPFFLSDNNLLLGLFRKMPFAR